MSKLCPWPNGGTQVDLLDLRHKLLSSADDVVSSLATGLSASALSFNVQAIDLEIRVCVDTNLTHSLLASFAEI